VKLERKIAGGSTAEMMLPKAGLKEILKGQGHRQRIQEQVGRGEEGGVPVLVRPPLRGARRIR
jgi:hypothetical protein